MFIHRSLGLDRLRYRRQVETWSDEVYELPNVETFRPRYTLSGSFVIVFRFRDRSHKKFLYKMERKP